MTWHDPEEMSIFEDQPRRGCLWVARHTFLVIVIWFAIAWWVG